MAKAKKDEVVSLDYFSQISKEAQAEILTLLPKRETGKNLLKRTQLKTGVVSYVLIRHMSAQDFEGDKNYKFTNCGTWEQEREFLAMDIFKAENKEA
jgi:hypothetical protein